MKFLVYDKMKVSMKNFIIGSLMGILTTSCSLFGVGGEEQPKYQILVKAENKEIRKYDSYIVAKTIIKGDFKDAQSKGFRILAGYIFGKNKSKQKIAMTSPVVQGPGSEKISMTSPVVISKDESSTNVANNSWVMTFSMPSQFNLETLPEPIDERILIEVVEERFVAALTFSGFWGEAKNTEKGRELTKWINENKDYEITSKPMFAGYNPPWTLPFLRRNEMLIEIRPIQGK